MTLPCKKCGEPIAKEEPFSVFEFRRHKLLPSDSAGMIHTDTIEEGGTFCSSKCLTDFLAGSDMSGVFDLTKLRQKLRDEGKL